MKNLNNLLSLGITGLPVAGIMHIILYLSAKIMLNQMKAYYHVWTVFFVIGITK